MKKNLTCHFLFVFIIFSFTSLSAQTTYYVNALLGNNANSGLNKSEAKQTISAAIAISNDGDVIRVSAGVYAESFNLNKAITIFGAGQSADPLKSTIITGTSSPVVNISAATLLAGQKAVLKNLRVAKATNGVAISINANNVNLEEVSAKGPSQQAIQLNSSVSNIFLNNCEVLESNIGLLINDDLDVNGLTVLNTKFYGNTTHSVMFRESQPNPAGMVQGVLFRNCFFENNNPTNNNLGHNIYVEKLSNATFENISIRTPFNNTQNAIDINLKWRQDYENITFKNINVFRETPGVGIFVKGRNDPPLYNTFPTALVSNINIEACRFQGCRTNIRFENNVNNITVNRCDLSNFDNQQGYGLANLTSSYAQLNASNNYFGTTNPTLSVGALAITFPGNNVVTLLPDMNPDLINIGDFAFGQNLPIGTTVVSKNLNALTLSNAPTIGSTQDILVFAPTISPYTNVFIGAPCPLVWDNKLENALVNSDNASFSDLQTAINSTPINGAIFNLDPGFIAGSIDVSESITFNMSGAGQLDANTLTNFDVLTVNPSATLTINSPIRVETQMLLNGTIDLNNQHLFLAGKNEGTGSYKGTPLSQITILGADSLGALRFDETSNQIYSLEIDRANNGNVLIGSDVTISDYFSVNEGTIENTGNNLLVNQPEVNFGPQAYVMGKLGLGVSSINTTFELDFPTGASNGKRIVTLTTVQGAAELTHYSTELVETAAYDLENNLPENVNRISPQRYWNLTKTDASQMVSGKFTISYQVGDLVIDQDVTKLQVLKDEGNGNEDWINLGGFANGIPAGNIISESNFTSLGHFTLGNVEGGFNLFADTIFVNAQTGDNNFDGTTPIHVIGTNAGPKLTVAAGFETVLPTGVVSVAAGNYPERAELNKRISLAKSGSGQVFVDTVAFVNGVNLIANFPNPTDFSVNTVDIGVASKVFDGFLLVGDDGVVYLRDTQSDEILSTSKSFTLKANNDFTLNTVTLNGSGNQLNFGTGFTIAGSLNLNGAQGGKAKIFDFDLIVNDLSVIQGVSNTSYIITGGTGNLRVLNVNGPSQFPIGTDLSFAPVTVESSILNFGLLSRVKAANTISSFSPVLPNTVNTFVKLQWTLNTLENISQQAKITFEYSDSDEENNFDSAPEIAVGRAISNFWSTITPSQNNNNLVAINNQSSIGGNYALFSKISIGFDKVNAFSAKAFPNPFEQFINLELSEQFEGSVQLIDITGRMVWSQNVNTTISSNAVLQGFDALPSGIYHLRLLSKTGQTNIPLIKQ